jgi:BirA family biotin operon repressor/biotin-[acetyl-CoA-carboxylase] ligase
MSFILHPSPRHWDGIPTLVTAFAAVSVCEAIEMTTGKTPQIKWVNDIFLDGKKICGISAEAITDFESGTMQWIVLGIGINFTTPKTGYPEEIKKIAGSVFSESRPTITRNELAAEVVNRILNFENKFDNSSMLAEYRKRLIMLGKKVVVSGSGEPYEAVAVDIDDIGRLIVKKDNGETLSLASGEISVGTV